MGKWRMRLKKQLKKWTFPWLGGLVMAKILMTATVQSHIAQFHKPVIRMLQEMGHRVEVAAANNLHLKENLTLTEPDAIHEVTFSRSPFSLMIFPAYKQRIRFNFCYYLSRWYSYLHFYLLPIIFP